MQTHCRHTLALACVVLVVPLIRAEPAPEPVPWSYRTPFNETAIGSGVTGGFSFPNESFTSTAGDVEIGITKVYSWSVATETNADRVTDLPYRFGVELRDDLSSQTALLSFQGTLSGRFWRTGSELTTTFVGDTVQSAELGGREYEIRLSGFDAPTGYGEAGGGMIRANVRLLDGGSPDAGPDSPSGENLQTPEPTTAVIALVGLPVVAWVRSARRRKTTGST